MMTPEKADKLLANAKGSTHFKLHLGTDIHNLKQLAEALDIMADAAFRHHVTESKNDFAAWIKHSIGDEELASSIEHIKDRKRMAEKLRNRVNFLEGKRNQNVICPKEFLSCGATDFALGALIGFVIGMIVAVVI